MHRLLVEQASAFHGSTALQLLFLSDHTVSNLCRHTAWQCELHAVSHNASLATLVSLLWTPDATTLVVKGTRWQPFDRAALALLRDKGIRPIVLRVLMYSPPCLYKLSRTLRARHDRNASAWRAAEQGGLARHAALVDGAAITLNYADVLWDFERVQAALQERLGLHVSDAFVPVVGCDVFAYNRLKTVGTLRAFAAAHPPASVGYNASTRQCNERLLGEEAEGNLHRLLEASRRDTLL